MHAKLYSEIGGLIIKSEKRNVRIGRRHITYYDQNRMSWDGKGSRPVATTIWYETTKDAREDLWATGMFKFGSSALDGPIGIKRKSPLIVISHGTGGSSAQLSWLAEGLVERGFVVAGVNHHGNTATEKLLPYGFLLTSERARDLSFALDKMLIDEDFSSFIDDRAIGAAGFSLGGYTALALAGAQLTFEDFQKRCENNNSNPACQLPPESKKLKVDFGEFIIKDQIFKEALKRDKLPTHDQRFKAIYSIAPAQVSLMETELDNINVPTRIVLATRDSQINYTLTKTTIDRTFSKACVLTVPYAGHYTFLAQGTLKGKILLGNLCRDNVMVNRKSIHRLVSNDAGEFFDNFLGRD